MANCSAPQRSGAQLRRFRLHEFTTLRITHVGVRRRSRLPTGHQHVCVRRLRYKLRRTVPHRIKAEPSCVAPPARVYRASYLVGVRRRTRRLPSRRQHVCVARPRHRQRSTGPRRRENPNPVTLLANDESIRLTDISGKQPNTKRTLAIVLAMSTILMRTTDIFRHDD